MFHTLGGIADVRMQKAVLDLVRLPLCAPEIVAHISDEFHFVSRALPPHPIGLDILVQELVCTVSRRTDKGPLCRLPSCGPALGRPSMR